jgi:hypothetical protein
MKRTVLILILCFFGSSIAYSQQSRTPTTDERKALNNAIDGAFLQWTKAWKYDKYVSRSIKVSSLEEDDDYGDLVVKGTFTFTRFFGMESHTIPFSANIAKEGETLKLKKLAYDDTTTGMKDSISFD